MDQKGHQMAMNSISAECGICLECFDENARRPLVLPCSHTFCQACLEQLEAEDNQTCSHCRREWTGTTLQDLLCCYQLIPSTDTTPMQNNPLCSEHGEDVLMWCESCSKDICVKCLWLNHKSCNWLPMDEKLKVAARKEFNSCLKDVKEMVTKNRETITSLNHLINELLTCQDEVKEWQAKAERVLLLTSEIENASQTTVTLTDLQSMVRELNEVKMKSPAARFASIEAILNQSTRLGLNPEASPMVAIGIDLGMMNSSLAIIQHGRVNIIRNEIGARKTPNYVSFTAEEILVGDPAKESAIFNSENTVFQILKVIGRRFSDPVVQEASKKFPFKIIENNGRPKIQVNYEGSVKHFTPEEILSMMLRKLKGEAENYLASPVTHAVISVPAHFNDSQRQATRDAAEMAELNILEIIDEPIAAAIAYGVDKSLTGQRNVVIFDLRKSSLDVSVVSFSEGEFEVRAVVSDSHTGGEVFCSRLVGHLLKEISRKHRKDFSDHQRALGRLKMSSEQAMEDLSYNQRHGISISCLVDGEDFESSITRVRFEELCCDIFRETIDTVQRALNDSGTSKVDIHEVILSGGASRIPKIRELLQAFFDGAKLNLTINPDEVVAHGTAVKAASLTPDTPAV